MSIDQSLLVFFFTTLGASYGIMFGGGSFMVFPILFLIGIDPKIAIATNIAAAIAQLATGIVVFSRHKKIHYEVVPLTTISYLIGGIIGAFVLIEINPHIIKQIISIVIILFALFGIFKKRLLLEGESKIGKHKSILVYPLLIILGVYQIVITAGSGTMMTFILIYLFGLNLKSAIYTRQIIVFPSMFIGASILIYNGLVDFNLFIPLVAGRITGAIIGSKLILNTESKKLSVIFTIVVIAIAIKTLIG